MDPLELLARHTALMVETAREITDPRAASLCVGWTRAHVLTHIARNADGLGRLSTWAVTGEPQEMYPGGLEGRNADIEAGASRGIADLVADVESSAAALAPKLARAQVEAVVDRVEMRGGRKVRPTSLPRIRLREVVYHHVDLLAGFGFDDVEDDVVGEFLRDEVRRLQVNPAHPDITLVTSAGDRMDVGSGGVEVTGTPAALLLWLARQDPRGVRGNRLPDLPAGG